MSNLGELHKRIKQIQSRVLQEYHISLMEYHIMVIMSRIRDVSQNDIAEALEVDKALISRQIRAMEQKGLLSCDPDPGCRRRKVLYLSEKAQSLVPRLDELHQSCLREIFSDVEEAQILELQIILEGLVSKI